MATSKTTPTKAGAKATANNKTQGKTTTMSDTALDFGAPVAVDALPPTNRGGRQSTRPAFEAWLAQLAPGAWYELASGEPDGAHPAGRVQQIKKIVAENGNAFEVATRPVEAGKRYRIFARVAS
jgi:hypothetical protein